MARSWRLRLLCWVLFLVLVATATSFYAAFGVGDWRAWLFTPLAVASLALVLVVDARAHMPPDEEEIVLPELGQTMPRVRSPDVPRRPWRCPVCFGASEVDEALYTRIRSPNGIRVAPCRSCNGEGIVWG